MHSLITTLLILFVSDANSISFSFNTFNETNIRNIKLLGNASHFESVIRLTENKLFQNSQATYARPIHLWTDSPSKTLADFVTNFTFSIDGQNNTNYADGLVFFLAKDHMTLNSTDNPFVGVEFDVFCNPWDDIGGPHVGIDYMTLKSLKSSAWDANVEGRRMDAGISYNSFSKTLCVEYTGFQNNVTSLQGFCYKRDLRDYLPEWVTVGFSASTGLFSESHIVHSWSFNTSLRNLDALASTTSPPPQQGAPTPPPQQGVPSPSPPGKRGLAGWMMGLIIGGCVVLIVTGIGLCWIWVCWYAKKRKTQSEDDPQDAQMDSINLTVAKCMSHDILASATNNFDENQKLGEGGFGAVFKGYLEDLNKYVAVKRISSSSDQGASEYIAEITIISQLRHRNLVQLIGWCHEKKDMLIVYEYLPNGSLDFHLFGSESLLNWEHRYKIALGLASALDYLHHGWRECVLHRDIKSSNVMLDSEFNPTLGDFGLARIVDHNARSQTLLGGSYGYMAPECLDTGRSSKESDVYSFGVVALEIATGKKPFVQLGGDGSQVHLMKWVWELYENGELVDGVDEKLQGNFVEIQMACLMIVGLWCAHPDPSMRPLMRNVINVLNFEAPMPDLLSE